MLRVNSAKSKTVSDSKLERNAGIELAIEENAPIDLCCCITFTALIDPVIGNDGRIYNRDAAAKLKNSPFTGRPFWLIERPPLNDQIKSIIQEWQNKARENYDLKQTNQALKNQLTSLNDTIKKELKPERNDLDIPAGELTKSRSNRMFFEAIRELNLKAAKYYLSNGANINFRDQDSGASALLLAMTMRLSDSVKAKNIIMMLCDEFHININLQNARGCTALHIAAGNNDEWSIEYLLSKSAHPLISNEFNDTPRQFGIKIHADKFNKLIHTLLLKKEFNYSHNSFNSLFSPSILVNERIKAEPEFKNSHPAQ